MAEGRWRMFHKGTLALCKGSYNLSAAGKWQMCLLGSEATGIASAPNLDISTTGSLSFGSTIADAKGNAITRTLTTAITATVSGLYRFTHDAKVFTATSGNQFSAKYAAIIYSGVATPFAICQLSTTRIVAAQITVNPPADGVFTIGNEVGSTTYSLA